MRRLYAALSALAVWSLMSPLPLMFSQAVTSETRTAGPFQYDIANEITLEGKVSSVLTQSSPGMIVGSHLILTTASGDVDISLGAFGLRGKGSLLVEVGDQVEAIGVLRTLNGARVLMARTVRAGSQIYTIRNQRGIPISSQGRERLKQKPSQHEGQI